MLLRYSIENHYSIRDKQTLSLVAAPLKDQKDVLIESVATHEEILPLALIFGANASGKTTIINGIRRMRSAVLFSHPKWEPGSTNRTPFRLDAEMAQKPTVQEIDFVVENVRYNYGFEINDDTVLAEWLYSFPKGRQQKLFERNQKEIDFGRGLKGKNKSITYRPDSLFLSAALQAGHEELKKIGDFFRNLRAEGMISKKDINAAETKERALRLLKALRTGVVNFREREDELPDEILLVNKAVRSIIQESGLSNKVRLQEDDKVVNIGVAHLDNRGQEIYLDERDESQGTRRLLYLLTLVFRTLDLGSVLLIDELDDSLHTEVCEAIIALFSSKECNPNGAQLIATTHNTNLLNTEFVRRDQFWFMEKDSSGASHLYPLTDIRTKKEDNKVRGYLEGRYGAVPFSVPIREIIKEFAYNGGN